MFFGGSVAVWINSPRTKYGLDFYMDRLLHTLSLSSLEIMELHLLTNLSIKMLNVNMFVKTKPLINRISLNISFLILVLWSCETHIYQ